MIRTYTVKELEDLSGLTRRTIGDYVSKGLLAGPSHRGRGACYSQSDVDILRVIPRLRVLMKKDFPTLRSLRNFLAKLSSREIHSLARKTNQDAFVLAVREIRLNMLLCAMFPRVSPDRIARTIAALSPEQIRAVDTGNSQLGSVIDISKLIDDGEDADEFDKTAAEGNLSKQVNGARHNGHRHHNGTGAEQRNGNGRASYPGNNPDTHPGNPWLNSSWSVGWLQGQPYPASLDESGNQTQFGSAGVANYGDSSSEVAGTKKDANSDRLSDIARRLERLERLLAAE